MGSCFPMEPGDWYALAKFDLTLRLQQSEHGTHSSRLQGERSQGTKIFVQLRPHTIINSDSKAHDGKLGASNKKMVWFVFGAHAYIRIIHRWTHSATYAGRL